MKNQKFDLKYSGWQGAFEFHINKFARIKYDFEEAIFEIKGNAVLADLMAARVFAQKMNDQRDLIAQPDLAVKASHTYAMGLIDEIMHLVVGLYKVQIDGEIVEKAYQWLERSLGETKLQETLRQFLYQFPPVTVFKNQQDVDAYLKGETEGISNHLVALEEMIMLWVSNQNPALAKYDELFSDAALTEQTDYQQAFTQLGTFFSYQPNFGPENETLLELLLLPGKKYPNSLFDQLEYMRQNWVDMLGDLLTRLLRSLDFFKEEEKMSFTGPGPITAPDFSGLMAGKFGDEEYERFSEDKYWMPRLVLIAKNTYVWLEQLSRKYKRAISRLDEIPDEELEMLSRWGITGIWFIGLWERSTSSRKIKQMMGQEDAVASAYSLYDYTIASEFGGDEALENLKGRAWRFGIRLGSDMVPNHMGMDSNWVINHPDRFLSLPYPPFPSYTFNGPDLCDDERVGVYLEDHYYNHSDASVVFKRVDHWTGDTRYIYHGNDGTSMPWNDTAQLNFLQQEVREVVIQTIFNVARRFNIIRFDAAMTLAKKHIQRLWFPEPGSGGDIASRSEHGLSKADFDKLIPTEFWREVVDRVAEEIPDTLLLAEAFWMMEGYFVRTLGMHRVYNSAFMHIVRDEENAKYRGIIKETIEFDPQILKRYVNFMNNPDEETAIEQFGDGDKYFGVCTLMATLPGLPMFGHGQVEGYREKYGMEYREAKWQEDPNHWLVERHEREIFPLLHKRYLFAEVEQFRLFDFYHAQGGVDENVYAFSNGFEDERGLVVYHNRFADTEGWIKTSAAFNRKTESGDQNLIQVSLGEALGLQNAHDHFVIFRENNSNLTFIRRSSEIHEKGLFLSLHAYETQVFLDFHEVQDTSGDYAQLEAHLQGSGVEDINETRLEILLKTILIPFGRVVNANRLSKLADGLAENKLEWEFSQIFQSNLEDFLTSLTNHLEISYQVSEISESIMQSLEKAAKSKILRDETFTDLSRAGQNDDPDSKFRSAVLFTYLLINRIGLVKSIENAKVYSYAWIDELMLGKVIREAFKGLGFDDYKAHLGLNLVKILANNSGWFNMRKITNAKTGKDLAALFTDPEIQTFIQVNQHEDVIWFNKETCQELLAVIWLGGLADINASYAQATARKKEKQFLAVKRLIPDMLEKSDYKLEKLVSLLSKLKD